MNYALKGFVYCLSRDSHIVIDRHVLTACHRSYQATVLSFGAALFARLLLLGLVHPQPRSWFMGSDRKHCCNY